MAYFNDQTSAVRTYPETEVTIEIIDVVTEGDALNVNEQANFKIKVINNGPLNLAGVTPRVKGLNGTTLKAPASASNGTAKNLAKAALEAWDVNLDHILIGHIDPLDTVKGIDRAEVVNA
jgi:hypothetical protein